MTPIVPRSADLTGVTSVAFDYGTTLSTSKRIDYALGMGQRPLDPDVAPALHTLHQQGKVLILASNTLPCETRWPALQAAGVADLFALALLSHSLNVRKPAPLFYRLVIAAADCAPEHILFVGDNLAHDVTAPLSHGMQACLIRPEGPRAHEEVPKRALIIPHVAALPDLLGA